MKAGRKTGRPKFRGWKRKWMSLVYPSGAGIKLIGNNRLKITFGKDAEGKQLRIIVFLREPLKSNSFGQVVIVKDPSGRRWCRWNNSSWSRWSFYQHFPLFDYHSL